MMNLCKKSDLYFKILRFTFFVILTAGFVYQTMDYLFFYLTYPTVINEQRTSPTHLEIPAFTFCNNAGFRAELICDRTAFPSGTCTSGIMTTKVFSDTLCPKLPQYCTNGKLEKGFTYISYAKFMDKFSFTREDVKKLAIPLEEYMNCTIEHEGKVTPCNMENVLGSYYSTDPVPQFCFAIYSLWGKPHKKREIIPKAASMKFKFFLNYTQRAPIVADSEGTLKWPAPNFNPPGDAFVQMAVHSPYFLPSPYIKGSAYIAGHSYELRIKMEEKHLLPPPYQTNCTDYMTAWYQRGGKAPVNQNDLIQECRINKTYEAVGCIPLHMDYPHPYNICKRCAAYLDKCDYVEPASNCSSLADSHNQPCSSERYEVTTYDKDILMETKVKTTFGHPSDAIRAYKPSHDCKLKNSFRPECSTVTIDVPFDQFEIKNTTYDPKCESLEVLSVVGGYMGLWTGISLLALYDTAYDAVLFVKSCLVQGIRRRTTVRKFKKKPRRMTRKPSANKRREAY